MGKLSDVKKQSTDRAKVEAWLDSIGEHDEACRAEVLAQCKEDASSRAYYVKRYDEINQAAQQRRGME